MPLRTPAPRLLLGLDAEAVDLHRRAGRGHLTGMVTVPTGREPSFGSVMIWRFLVDAGLEAHRRETDVVPQHRDAAAGGARGGDERQLAGGTAVRVSMPPRRAPRMMVPR